MKLQKRKLLYGFLLWLPIFGFSMLLNPLRDFSKSLYESVMPIVITFFTVFFSVSYFRRVKKKKLMKHGIRVGIAWVVIMWIIDFFMYIWGPVNMNFVEYITNIGVLYLMIPVITIGFAMLGKKRR